MAARKALRQELCEEATCSICLDYFKNPVMIPECGHNFCQACLDQYWRNLGFIVSCPHCRVQVLQRKVTPNRPLANLVDIAKKLSGEKKSRNEENICDKHGEPQKLFCQDDKVLICVVCDRSKEHRNHQVIPVEEASEEYKDQIMNCLKTFREKRKELLSYKANTEKETQDLLKELKVEREKTTMVFRQLHRFLEEQEILLVFQMEEIMEEIKRERQTHLDKLKKEFLSLESVIQKMEEKLHQSAVGLLQDLESFMQRCKGQKISENLPIAFPVALKWKIWDFCDINPFLEGVAKQFQDSLLSGLQLKKANVHLDPETAHPTLVVSQDRRSVRQAEMPQEAPDSPERFDEWSSVLGRQEFAAGRHFWEVFVGPEGSWSVGVARNSIKRKGYGTWGSAGIWKVGKWAKAYRRSADGISKKLSLNEEPRKIRVALNCEGGRVTFYDADRGTLICEYSGISFTRDTLRPFSYLSGNAHLVLSS